MKTYQTVFRVTAHLHRNISGEVLEALREAGVTDFHIYSARSPVIEEKRGLLSMLPLNDLTQDPLDAFLFLVKPEAADSLAHLIIEKGHLYFPGRGSLAIEEVELLETHELCGVNPMEPPETPPLPVHMHAGTGFCCIVKRGEGNRVGRIPLDMGTCVPAIHFGTGTGIRDKMGLLRVAIPAEKEIIQGVAPSHEADDILEMMIETGRLDQPGNGFIYTFPVKRALVNIRVRRGDQRHAASIEQIVTAIDHIKGNPDWRQRRSVAGKRTAPKRRYMRHLVDLVLLCDAGTGPGLVETAMAAGAGGATLFSLKHIRPGDSPLGRISPLRDACSMGIPEGMEETVADALKGAGAFTDRCHGQVHVRRTFKAFTYTGK
jgi:hypothetical protein